MERHLNIYGKTQGHRSSGNRLHRQNKLVDDSFYQRKTDLDLIDRNLTYNNYVDKLKHGAIQALRYELDVQRHARHNYS